MKGLARPASVAALVIFSVALLSFMALAAVRADPVSAPTLYSPENGTVTLNPMPTFVWVRVDGAHAYRLVVNKNLDFSGDNVIDVTLENSENSYTVPFENRLGWDNYWWKVASIESGAENWSDPWKLEVIEENTVRIYASEATWIEQYGIIPVANPSFESGSSENAQDAENWVESGAAQRQPWSNHTGDWGMALCWWVSESGEAYQQVGVQGGEEYVFSIWACADPNFVGTFYMKLAWYKNGGTTYISENSQNITLSTNWEKKTLTATAPADADTVRLVFGGTGLHDNAAKFDDVEFKVVSPNYNYDWRLGVSGISGYERYSYLKFDLSDIPAGYWIKTAVLYAYYSYGGSQGDNIAVHRQENDGWTDGSLTWNNAPDPKYGEYISENVLPSSSGWITWDVRDWVDNQYKGDGVASMVILTPGPTEFWLVSDNASEHPYIEVTYSYFSVPILSLPENNAVVHKVPTFVWVPLVGMENHRLLIDNDPDFASPIENLLFGPSVGSYAVPISDNLPLGKYYWKVVGIKGDMEVESQVYTFTVSSTVRVTIPPLADAKVEKGSPSSNYGGDTHIAVASPHESYRRRSFLKFDLSSVPVGSIIESAQLSLYKYDETGRENTDTNRDIGVYRVEDDSWSESTITWSNQPTIGPLENYIHTPTTVGFWESWDLTEWVEDQYQADNVLSVALKMVDERGDWNSAEAWYYSKEYSAAAYRPHLMLTCSWVGSPVPLSPENALLTHDNTPTFSWSPGKEAQGYRIVIDNSPSFSSPKLSVLLGATDNTYTVPEENALKYGVLYYWKVIAIRDDVEVSSEVRTFRLTSAPILSSVNITLENGARVVTRTPTLSWIPGPFATAQRLVVNDTPDFTGDNEIDVTLGPGDNSYRIPVDHALAPGTYWWKVAAIGSENWSDVWEFEVVESAAEDISALEDSHALRAAGWEAHDGDQQFLYTGSWNDGLIFMKFELSSLPIGGVVAEARLWMYCTQLDGRGYVIAYAQENDNWSELTLNRNNYPQTVGAAVASAYLRSTGWVSWDITRWIEEEYTGDGIASVTLRYRGTDDPKSAKFWSSEYTNSAYRPYLHVVLEFLEAPSLVSPSMGATTSTAPTLSWIPGKGAESHRLLVDDDPVFGSPEVDVVLGATAGSYTLSGGEALAPGATYYWKVVAVREGVEKSSEVGSFTVESVPVTYLLTVTVNPVGGGSVTPSSGVYAEGSTVTIEAVPAIGYEFDCWSGDASGTHSTITVRMDSDKRIVANFKAVGAQPIAPQPASREAQDQVLFAVSVATLAGAILLLFKLH